MHKITPEKRQELLNTANTGEYTLSEMGEMYGITRSRVGQIIFDATGKNYRTRINKNRKIKRAEKKAYGERLLCYCQAVDCGVPVYAKNINSGGKRKFCEAHTLLTKQNKCVTVKFTCARCQIRFYPLRNYVYQGREQKYCSPDCYGLAIRKSTRKAPEESHSVL